MSQGKGITRVQWQEMRRVPGGGREIFLVIAERKPGQWTFVERSTWEIFWYPLRSTRRLIAKADTLVAQGRDQDPAAAGKIDGKEVKP